MDKMQYNESQQKTLRMEKDLIEKIEELAKENQRDFTKQVKFMLRKYIELIEKK